MVARLMLLVVLLLNVAIAAALVLLRPVAGPRVALETCALDDLLPSLQRRIEPLTSSPMTPLLLERSELASYDLARVERAVAEARAKRAEYQAAATEEARRHAADVYRATEPHEDRARGRALLAALGLLLAPVGLYLVGRGLPRNGTVLTVLLMLSTAKELNLALMATMLLTLVTLVLCFALRARVPRGASIFRRSA